MKKNGTLWLLVGMILGYTGYADAVENTAKKIIEVELLGKYRACSFENSIVPFIYGIGDETTICIERQLGEQSLIFSVPNDKVTYILIPKGRVTVEFIFDEKGPFFKPGFFSINNKQDYKLQAPLSGIIVRAPQPYFGELTKK